MTQRFETIMESDKVLIIENGKAIEFDAPETLLKRPNSRLKGLI